MEGSRGWMFWGFGGTRRILPSWRWLGKASELEADPGQARLCWSLVQVTVMYGVLLDKESGASESSLESCFTACIVIGAGTSGGKVAWRTTTCKNSCLRNQEGRNRG